MPNLISNHGLLYSQEVDIFLNLSVLAQERG